MAHASAALARSIFRGMVLGVVIGVAVTAMAATGLAAMAIYAAWADDQRFTDGNYCDE